MSDAQAIWRLGRWIGLRRPGRIRLRHRQGELVLEVREGQIVAAEGLDNAVVEQAFGQAPPPAADVLATARARAAVRGIAETEAVGVAKRLIQAELRTWYADPDRRLEIMDEVPAPSEGHTISVTHAIVELILSEPDGGLMDQVLSDRNALLRRSDGFLELYVPLGLSEEADLIVAKITGQRTASEIISRSPQPEDEVSRLLAALTATGMLEAVPVVEPDSESEGRPALESPFVSEVPEHRRRLSPGLLLAAAVIIALLATLAWWFLVRDHRVAAAESATGRWGIVIDLGCEPQEYRRLLDVARRHPNVQALAVGDENGESQGCWRLVWGSFSSSEGAREGIATIPPTLVRDGFDPHIVAIPDPDPTAGG